MITASTPSNPYPNLSTQVVHPVALSATVDSQESKTLQEKGVQSVSNEMNRRATHVGYGLGVFFGRLFGTRSEELTSRSIEPPHVDLQSVKRQSVNGTIPFSSIYDAVFPQDTIRVLYIELDPGVDDGTALLQLLAAKQKSAGKKIEVAGIVPCVGNAVLNQTEINTMQFLELTGNQNIPVYPGAVTPLAFENNQTAINEVNQGINATHFYGYDGEEDVGGWPKISMQVQTTPGYIYAASLISNASQEAPLTLVSTSALTELAKTLTLLDQLDKKKGVPEGTFASNISGIFIMGGCLNPEETQCNAPSNVPDDQKDSEANFYFDSPAAQIVFTTCQKYSIKIFLIPLDLTQQQGLMWTQDQNDTLNQINNRVSVQWARVTSVIPYIDKLHFTNGYPMHDMHTVTPLTYPAFFDVMPISASIGNVGQMIQNPNATNAQRNVYVLSVPLEKQATYYSTVLQDFRNFSPQASLSFFDKVLITSLGVTLLAGSILGGIFAVRKCHKGEETPNEATKLLNNEKK